MRVLKNKWFSRFARRNRIDDNVLIDAVFRANLGLVDADLGGGLIKQRIARKNDGKSGGYRSILLFRKQEIAVFVFGFTKNEIGNIPPAELESARDIAKVLLRFDAAAFKTELKSGRLVEVRDVEKKVQE